MDDPYHLYGYNHLSEVQRDIVALLTHATDKSHRYREGREAQNWRHAAHVDPVLHLKPGFTRASVLDTLYRFDSATNVGVAAGVTFAILHAQAWLFADEREPDHRRLELTQSYTDLAVLLAQAFLLATTTTTSVAVDRISHMLFHLWREMFTGPAVTSNAPWLSPSALQQCLSYLVATRIKARLVNLPYSQLPDCVLNYRRLMSQVPPVHQYAFALEDLNDVQTYTVARPTAVWGATSPRDTPPVQPAASVPDEPPVVVEPATRPLRPASRRIIFAEDLAKEGDAV